MIARPVELPDRTEVFFTTLAYGVQGAPELVVGLVCPTHGVMKAVDEYDKVPGVSVLFGTRFAEGVVDANPARSH